MGDGGIVLGMSMWGGVCRGLLALHWACVAGCMHGGCRQLLCGMGACGMLHGGMRHGGMRLVWGVRWGGEGERGTEGDCAHKPMARYCQPIANAGLRQHQLLCRPHTLPSSHMHAALQPCSPPTKLLARQAPILPPLPPPHTHRALQATTTQPQLRGIWEASSSTVMRWVGGC